MGQYHLVVNLDKREFLMPHKLGSGLKLWEQLANHHPGTSTASSPSSRCPTGAAAATSTVQFPGVVGRWGGDRIAIVGDYALDTDLDPSLDPQPGTIYYRCIDRDTDLATVVNADKPRPPPVHGHHRPREAAPAQGAQPGRQPRMAGPRSRRPAAGTRAARDNHAEECVRRRHADELEFALRDCAPQKGAAR